MVMKPIKSNKKSHDPSGSTPAAMGAKSSVSKTKTQPRKDEEIGTETEREDLEDEGLDEDDLE
jgi:hypothetical protein